MAWATSSRTVLRSLGLRLFLSFLLVVGVAVAVVAFTTHRTTAQRFHSYVAQGEAAEVARTRDVLQTQFRDVSDWAQAEQVLSTLGSIRGERLLITDGNGRVLADSSGELAGSTIDEDQAGFVLPLVSSNGVVGILHVISTRRGPQPWAAPQAQSSTRSDPVAERARLEGSFLSSVRRSLLWAALSAAGVAVVLSLLLSRQLTARLRSLRTAAHGIAKGNLSQRVEVQGKDEVAELSSSFNYMAESLERNERARRELTADVAHELRTPLSIIQGTVEAIQDGVATAGPDMIASIHEETLLLGRLVTDLRDLSLAEAGQLQLQREPTDMCVLMERVVARWQQEATEKGVELSLECQTSPVADADPSRIGQVADNLLSNALRHTPSGSRVSVTVSSHGPAPERGKPRPAVLVTVRDTGDGIPTEDLPRVFDRFYRVDHSRSRASGGSGIGLAIAKYFVEMHGGTIWAESEAGNGSSFSFSLPLASQA
jgi:signal transduction histidine kinase